MIHRTLRWLRLLEDSVLVLLLLSMILLAVAQIGLRNLFDSGLIWGDALLRVLVLWVGLIGAMVASRKGEHISIDVVSRFAAPAFKKLLTLITNLSTGAICLLLAYHSFRFVLLEYEDGFTAFGTVPNWICAAILPVSFSIIALRYLLLSITACRNAPLQGNSE